MVECNLSLAVQITSIVAGSFAIVIGIYCMFDLNDGSSKFKQFILNAFLVVFGVGIVMIEVYLFEIVKYFGFMLRNWGKALLYLFMGCFVFWTKGIRLVASIIFWVLSVIYFVFFFLKTPLAAPLLQKNTGVAFEVTNDDYYASS